MTCNSYLPRTGLHRLPAILLLLLTSLVTSHGGRLLPFKQSGVITSGHDVSANITNLVRLMVWKKQILNRLNMTAEPEPPTKKPPGDPIVITSILTVPPKPTPRNLTRTGAIVWSEPLPDTRKKTADHLLFRVSNQQRQTSVINRATLLLRLRSTDGRLRRKSVKTSLKSREKKTKRKKLPDLQGRGFQNDAEQESSRGSKRTTNKNGKKKKSLRARRGKTNKVRPSRSRRGKKSRRVKVLVQMKNAKSGKFKRVAVQRVVVDKKFRWIKLPIPAAQVTRALRSSNHTLVLRVRCKRCYKGGVSIDNALPRKKLRRSEKQGRDDFSRRSSAHLNPNRPYLVISVADTPISTAQGSS